MNLNCRTDSVMPHVFVRKDKGPERNVASEPFMLENKSSTIQGFYYSTLGALWSTAIS